MVSGLTEILAELYAEGRQENRETAARILEKLEAARNYVPSSDLIRREYTHVLLEAYRTYAADQDKAGETSA